MIKHEEKCHAMELVFVYEYMQILPVNIHIEHRPYNNEQLRRG